MTREELYKYLWALVITEGILQDGEPFEWLRKRDARRNRRKTLMERLADFADLLQKESREYTIATTRKIFTGDFVDWLSLRALWIKETRRDVWARNLRAALRWLDALHVGTRTAMKRTKPDEVERISEIVEIAKHMDEEEADE